MAKSLNVLIQYCCPQHTLSRFTGWLAECRWKWFKDWAIKRLIRKYGVNLSEASSENIDDYPNFNSFFTRTLKPGLRPLVQGEAEIASPADGCVSQIGQIHADTILQAKGFYYSANTLLGNSAETAKQFQNGSFVTIYLAPKDYHRVHMPIAGTLRSSIYIPGQLFSVNRYTAEAVPNLFARNERLVCIFDTAAGPMAVILVGAMLVGSIHTSWEAKHPINRITTQYYAEKIHLERGAELGHFKMGSTVIVLFGEHATQWTSELHENSVVKMGQLIGTLK